MASKLNVVTGATGLLGSHITRQLVERGERVRAVLRSSGPSSFLKDLGVETVVADLQDPAALKRAVANADIVYHCAARVSDWSPWRAFEAETIGGTRNVLEACRVIGVGRVLHVSSISVYGWETGSETVTEETPLADLDSLWRWDYYARSKILAEEVVRSYGSLVSIIRPCWFYGSGDRSWVPRMAHNLRRGRAAIIGPGDNLLNLLHVTDVAACAILVANQAKAQGQSYNLASAGEATQLQLLNALTDALGLPRLQRRVSFAFALRAALLVEVIAWLIRKRTPPRYTRRAVYLMARRTDFSTAKAQTELGWQPRVGINEGIKETLDWYLREEARQHKSSAQEPRTQ